MSAKEDSGAREIFGVIARYKNGDALLRSARKTREAGYRIIEAYSPFPVEGLSEALGHRESRLPLLFFCGGAAGGVLGFMMEYIANVWAYPLNIGARPFNSWPAFIPIAFELTVLFAVLSGFVGLLLRCGMPRLNHPVFSAPGFDRASLDGFFLCIMAEDEKFDRTAAEEFLKSTGPEEINGI